MSKVQQSPAEMQTMISQTVAQSQAPFEAHQAQRDTRHAQVPAAPTTNDIQAIVQSAIQSMMEPQIQILQKQLGASGTQVANPGDKCGYCMTPATQTCNTCNIRTCVHHYVSVSNECRTCNRTTLSNQREDANRETQRQAEKAMQQTSEEMKKRSTS